MANRLANSTSPFLLAHAANLVDWWEWEEAAFEEARRRNLPVLLSVGYAACHWCHVMAHESFEDEATAAYLNEHFVSIKIDREERPDVDAVYMNATQAITGHGGWPMTCVLDHDRVPFFAGTYFPDGPRQGSPSFRQVLEALSDAWRNRGDDVGQTAEEIRRHLQAPGALPTGSPAIARTSCCVSCAPRRMASPARWTRTPRGSRGSSTPGHRRSCARRSATRTARGRRRSSRSPRRTPTTHPHSNPETNPSSQTDSKDQPLHHSRGLDLAGFHQGRSGWSARPRVS
jgi:Protein of unknown function, DUF255